MGLKKNATPDRSLTSIKFADQSVIPRNTSFISRSTNLFDALTAISGAGLNSTTGVLTVNATAFASGIIPILPNVEYSVNGTSVRRVLYDVSMVFISTSTTSGTFTTPTNAAFMRLSAPTAQLNTLQLNESATLLDYEVFYNDLNNIGVNGNLIKSQSIHNSQYASDSITPDKIKFITKSSNLFDAVNVTLGKSLDTVTGAVVDNLTSTISPIINASEGKEYTINGTGVRRILYDKDMKFISSSTTAGTFTTPTNTVFIRLAVPNSQVVTTQLNEGNTLLPYEDFYNYIDLSLMGNKLPYRFSTEEIIGDYVPISVEASDGSVVGGFNQETDMVQDIYGKYDALVALYPSYITKDLIGYDSAGVLPIYSYTFNPTLSQRTAIGYGYTPYPKIIIGGGIHGNGTEDSGDSHAQVYSLYYFLKDICSNWDQSSILEYLRWKVRFVVVPIQNPWGFNNRSRRNENLVDLARNYDHIWYAGTLGSDTYGGTAPFSEVEAQAMRDLIISNADAITITDFHGRGAPPDDQLIMFDITKGNELYYVAEHHIGKLSRKWRNYELTDLEFYGYILDNLAPNGKVHGWGTKVMKIPSAVVEGFANSGSVGTLTTNGIEVMTMNAELSGNWIVSMLKHFKSKY